MILIASGYQFRVSITSEDSYSLSNRSQDPDEKTARAHRTALGAAREERRGVQRRPLSPPRKIRRDSLIHTYRGRSVCFPPRPHATFRTRDSLCEPTTGSRGGWREAARHRFQNLRNQAGGRTRAGSDLFRLPDPGPRVSLRPRPGQAIPSAAPCDRGAHPDLLPRYYF